MQPEDKVIMYLMGEMSEKENLLFETQMDNNIELKNLFTEYERLFHDIENDPVERPSLQMTHRFNQLLESERRSNVRPLASKWKQYTAIAASVIILISAGVLFGIQYNQNSILDLQSKELSAIKRQISSMLSDQSVPTRVNAMYVAQNQPNSDDGLLDMLIQAMKEDESSHVRLAAVQAISGYEKNVLAKEALIHQLENESDPFVKVAIIQSLSKMKETNAVHTFDNLIEDEQTPKFIKDEAHKAKLELTKI
jgi:hypothetical protein